MSGVFRRPWNYRVGRNRIRSIVVILGSNSLSGTVVDATGNPVNGGPVGLYYTSTMALIAATVTDASGWYIFNGLLATPRHYFIVARDPAGVCNAEVFDHLTAGGGA
jgi:hypothetical protein